MKIPQHQGFISIRHRAQGSGPERPPRLVESGYIKIGAHCWRVPPGKDRQLIKVDLHVIKGSFDGRAFGVVMQIKQRIHGERVQVFFVTAASKAARIGVVAEILQQGETRVGFRMEDPGGGKAHFVQMGGDLKIGGETCGIVPIVHQDHVLPEKPGILSSRCIGGEYLQVAVCKTAAREKPARVFGQKV